jgi:hypothetical protein
MARVRAAARNRETDRARWVPPDRREPPGTEPGGLRGRCGGTGRDGWARRLIGVVRTGRVRLKPAGYRPGGLAGDRGVSILQPTVAIGGISNV